MSDGEKPVDQEVEITTTMENYSAKVTVHIHGDMRSLEIDERLTELEAMDMLTDAAASLARKLMIAELKARVEEAIEAKAV